MHGFINYSEILCSRLRGGDFGACPGGRLDLRFCLRHKPLHVDWQIEANRSELVDKPSNISPLKIDRHAFVLVWSLFDQDANKDQLYSLKREQR